MSDRQVFTFQDYITLIESAVAGGYRFQSFSDDSGEPGVMLLRHDIDKDVSRARQIAEIEHRLSIRATYFFLLRCPLYSLLEPESIEHVRAIAEMGHWIGLHCDERRMMQAQPVSHDSFDEAVLRELIVLEQVLGFPSSRAVSFHNPTREVVGRVPQAGSYVSAYDPRFMAPATKYLSDSNAFWREGDPVRVLRNGKWQRLQILIHPFWWAWDKPQPVTTVLRELLDKRNQQVHSYLLWSNDIWRDFCKEKEA